MKWAYIMLILLCITVAFLPMLHRLDLPQISLPKEAHNLVGNIPIVEMIDDGPNYINQREIKYCDETWPLFSCEMRFGYSYGVSHRIASGEFLESCEEAVKDEASAVEFCIEQCNDLMSIIPRGGSDYNCVERCEKEESRYVPECDGLPKEKSAKEKYNDLYKNDDN